MAHKKTADNNRPFRNLTPHVPTQRNHSKSARLEQSAQGGWGAWNRSLPSRAIEATRVLSSRTLAKARRKWGKIEKFARSLVKSCEAFQSNDHMTARKQMGGSAMENSIDQRLRSESSADVIHFPSAPKAVSFDRQELSQILNLYGRHVAAGEWRDYAMEFGKDAATFMVFRRASEQPLYRIIKTPDMARKQGQYSVVAHGGLILKRGQDLSLVLRVLLKSPKLSGA
jgi:Protein of unknown function (DUF2794)